MDDVCFIQTVFDFTSFDVDDCFFYGPWNCTSFGVRHQAFGTQYTTQTTNNAHHIGCCYCNVKTEPVFILDFGDQILCSYEIRTSCQSFFSFVAFCEYQYTNCFTCAVGKNDCTTNLLISMSAVNAQTNMCFYSCIKLCCGSFLHQIDSFCCIIESCSVYQFRSFNIFFSSFHFRDLLMW